MKAAHPKPTAESLHPTDAGSRMFSLTAYILMMWASLIVIQGFVIGQAILTNEGGLNLLQGLMVIFISGSLLAVSMALNGWPGFRYGIPFTIQARSTYGVTGARFPMVVRLFPAIVWYGIGSWIAALSLDAIVQTLTGLTHPHARLFYFVTLLGLQTLLAYRGVRVMKWFNVSASIALIIIMAYMMVHVIRNSGPQIATAWAAPGSWGLAFWGAVNASIGGLASVVTNASDLTRYMQGRPADLWAGQFLGYLPPLFFMLSLGFLAAVTTQEWDPIRALMQLSPDRTVMLLLLVFIFAAQFSTNLTLNILPPALILEEIAGVGWKTGTIVAALLALVSCPWFILESGDNFFSFINYYTCFFGPILGCMLADLYLRRGRLDISGLYDTSRGSVFWYNRGINIIGVIATLIPALASMAFALKLSWLAGLPLAFIIYVALSRLFFPELFSDPTAVHSRTKANGA